MSISKKYFPERYSTIRSRNNEMLETFEESDFDPDYSKRVEDDNEIDYLREFIRQPVNAWQEGSFLPDEILDERDNILAKLGKTENLSSNNQKTEKDKKRNHPSIENIHSPVWQEWQDWISKAKEMIIVHRKLEQETVLARDYIRFYQSGRNIYEISPLLKQLLENKDAGHFRFKDFNLPYKTVYFYLGNNTELEYPIDYYEEKFDVYLAEQLNFDTFEDEDEYYLNKKFLLEGAYVSKTRENCIDVQLCFKDPSDNSNEDLNIESDHRFPSFDFTISFEKWDKLEREEETTFNDSTIVFCDFWDNKADIGEIKYSKLNRLTNEPENCYDSEWKEYVLIDKSLRIIFNCIKFINANEQDTELFATNEKANQLLENLHKTKEVQKRNKLKQKLSEFSYDKVHLIGHKLGENTDSIKIE